MLGGTETEGKILALAGGVGGAKLAHGLALTGLGARLSVIVNTGDDFSLYGLHISPDLDTVMYTLGGVANREAGWGVAGDSYVTLEMIRSYGHDTWFLLGDKDFATHILRTERLRAGMRLTEVTAELAGGLGIQAQILPMCDEPVATLVETDEGELDFQEYFVRRRHADDVRGVRFAGIEQATVSPDVDRALADAEVIVLCPSNPFVSIDPILRVPLRQAQGGNFRARLGETAVPVVAVSPIVGGQAIKGPAAQMLASLGHDVSAASVAALYSDFLDGIVIDEADRELAGRISDMGIAVEVTGTVMRDDDDRRRLASETLDFAARLRERASA